MKLSQEVVVIDTLEELDNFFHDKSLEIMNSKDKNAARNIMKKYKLSLSDDLNEIGMDNLTEMMMMRCIDRVMNNLDLKNSGDRDRKHNITFEETIYPILKGCKEVTYH